MKVYEYGMRLRGFSPACQPMDGLVDWREDEDGFYHNILTYNRELTEEEMRRYELDFLNIDIRRT